MKLGKESVASTLRAVFDAAKAMSNGRFVCEDMLYRLNPVQGDDLEVSARVNGRPVMLVCEFTSVALVGNNLKRNIELLRKKLSRLPKDHEAYGLLVTLDLPSPLPQELVSSGISYVTLSGDVYLSLKDFFLCFRTLPPLGATYRRAASLTKALVGKYASAIALALVNSANTIWTIKRLHDETDVSMADGYKFKQRLMYLGMLEQSQGTKFRVTPDGVTALSNWLESGGMKIAAGQSRQRQARRLARSYRRQKALDELLEEPDVNKAKSTENQKRRKESSAHESL